MNELSALLSAVNVEGWSSREIATKARALGHPVGHATVNNYMAGRVPKKPSEDVLLALEAVFKIPLVDLRIAADLSASVTSVDLPPEASRLTPRQWAAVHEIIMAMVNPGEGREEADELAVRRAQETRDAELRARQRAAAISAREVPPRKK